MYERGFLDTHPILVKEDARLKELKKIALTIKLWQHRPSEHLTSP